MPLTNVWMRDPNRQNEWFHTSIEQVDKRFKTSVSAKSHMLRCNICNQYIIFVKGTIYVSSHFKHNRADQDKECEERANGLSGYAGPGSSDDLPGLLRLRIGNTRPHLEVGFYPVNEEQLQKAIDAKAKIKVIGLFGAPREYLIDRSRFAPNTTTWLPLDFTWAEKYDVVFSSSAVIPARWKNERATVARNGSIFDGETRRLVSKGSDIAVGRKYYLLCGKKVVISFRECVNARKLDTETDDWNLYELIVPAYSITAAELFWDRFGLRLTVHPAEIVPVWPPVIEKDDLLETKQKELFLLFKGESEFTCYPLFADFKERRTKISNEATLIRLGNVASLQMISSYRNSHKLNAVYVSPWEQLPQVKLPDLIISDDNGVPVPGEFLDHAPLRGILKVVSEVDALADVKDRNGFLYRKGIPAQQEVRLTDLKDGMEVVFRQGLVIVRRIQFGMQKPVALKITRNSLKPWNGEMVPFPIRYAWLLNEAEPGSELQNRIREALQKGQIPKDGIQYILNWRRGR